MIKVGIIGTGFGAKVHLPGFNKISGVKVVGIYGKNFAKAQKIAKKNNIPLIFKSWQSLICNTRIDAVSIAVPPHLHAKIALAAIKNKKAVLCEKPLACSIIETQKMLKAASAAKITHAINFDYHYVPAFVTLKKLLAKKIIGRLRYLNVSWTSGGRADKNTNIGWSNYKKYGGGVLLNYASHVIDYVGWLFGPAKAVSGQLHTIKQFNKIKSKPNADDLVAAQLKLANGTLCNMLITNVVFGGQGQRLDIYGDNGTIILCNQNVRDFGRNFKLSVIFSNGTIKQVAIPRLPNDKRQTDSRLAPFVALATDFIKGIKKRQLFAPSFVEGYRTQKIIAAIQKSDSKNKWITI